MTATVPAPRSAYRPEAVDDALAMPAGATWHRVALQVNPYGYRGKAAPYATFGDEESYNAALVSAFVAAGIGLIGITDHWCARTGETLARAAEDAGIVALPGFEAVSAEGVHLLVLFERGTDLGTVDAAIGACGASPGDPFTTLGAPIREILTRSKERGFSVVPAHVNGPDGLLTTLSGRALIDVWRDERLHAVCVSPDRELSTLHVRILGNEEHEYRRQHAMSRLHSDDVCEPTRIATPSGSCWIKMSTPSLAALDLATRTPETRVLLADPESSAPCAITAVAWEGGFLDGVRLRLSDALTCVVGGRGTGKSTVIESLRYVLGLEAIGKAAQGGLRSLVSSNVLGAGTKISVHLRGPDGEFVVERTVPEPPVVRDASGTVLASRPADVLGPVEIFGQHELAELADSKDYVAELLRRVSGHGETVPSTVPARLARNREAIVSARAQLAEFDDALDELPRLEEALAQFRGARLDERLDERSRVDRERRLLDTASRRIDDLVDAARPLRDDGHLDRSFLAPDALDGLPNASTLARLGATLDALHAELSDALESVDRAVDAARAAVGVVEGDWSAATSRVREDHDAALRALQAEGYDAGRYVATQKAVQRLAPLTERRAQLAHRIEALYTERRQLLAALDDHVGEDRRRLARACSEASQPVSGTVRVIPERSTDRSGVVALVENGVRGQKIQIKHAVGQEDFSPRALAEAARRGPEALVAFDIHGAQAAGLATAGEELFLRLEEMTVGHAVAVSLNVGGHFRALDELSKGQKATALLLLLLGAARGPLIVDQPEDDLDNRFVWEGVVPRLRALKGTRQVVFSTHNANIPVLGDAELVLVLESIAQQQGQLAPGGAGSLDDPTVLSLAEAILEGGPDAFLKRRYLYGF